MDELSLIPTDELLKELFSRYDHAVFAGEKSMDSEYHGVHKKWTGQHLACIGLAYHIQAMCHKEHLETSVPVDPEDF